MPVFQVFLQGCDTEFLRLEQALKVLAGIDDPACQDHSSIIEQYRVRQTVDLVCHPESGGNDIRKWLKAMCPTKLGVRSALTIARPLSAQP